MKSILRDLLNEFDNRSIASVQLSSPLNVLMRYDDNLLYLGKIGSPCGWTWVDAKVDGKPYVGAMPPVTATAEGILTIV